MCLIIDKEAVPQIAEEDIVVYKLLSSLDDVTAGANYFDFEYTLGVLYTTELKEAPGDEWLPFSRKEASAYMDPHDFRQYRTPKCLADNNIKAIGAGFHSLLTFEIARSEVSASAVNIFECIIPKGSLYYRNKVDYVVSNQIIIVRKC